MKDKHPISGNQRGAILITSIIILAFLAVLGMALVGFLFSRMMQVQLQIDRLQALYLAEAGVAKAIHELRFNTDPDGDGSGTLPRTRLQDGYFWTLHNFELSTITSTGEINDVKRTVQIKYGTI